MTHREFIQIIDDALPAGVYVVAGKPAPYYRLILTDLYDEARYLDKSYLLRGRGFYGIIDEVMKDVEVFKKWWSSPLMEALK